MDMPPEAGVFLTVVIGIGLVISVLLPKPVIDFFVAIIKKKYGE